jgi:hypothetical protein
MNTDNTSLIPSNYTITATIDNNTLLKLLILGLVLIVMYFFIKKIMG